jgi:hypothetical protein
MLSLEGSGGFGQEAEKPSSTDSIEWFSATLDECADPLAGFLCLLGDVVWHCPRLLYAGERFPIAHLNAAIGGTQNIQLKVNFLERAIDPAYRKDDVDVDYGIDRVEAGGPESAAGNQLDEWRLEYTRARAVGRPPRRASGDAQPSAKLVLAEETSRGDPCGAARPFVSPNFDQAVVGHFMLTRKYNRERGSFPCAA